MLSDLKHMSKLVRTNFIYRVLGTTTAAIFFHMIILFMHLLPRMNVMLYFICMGPVDLPGARRKRQNSNDKFLPTVKLEPTTLIFVA